MARASTTGASDAPGNVRRLPGPRSRGALRRPRSHPEKNYGHSLRPCIAWCSRPRKRATLPGTSLGRLAREVGDAPAERNEERCVADERDRLASPEEAEIAAPEGDESPEPRVAHRLRLSSRRVQSSRLRRRLHARTAGPRPRAGGLPAARSALRADA